MQGKGRDSGDLVQGAAVKNLVQGAAVKNHSELSSLLLLYKQDRLVEGSITSLDSRFAGSRVAYIFPVRQKHVKRSLDSMMRHKTSPCVSMMRHKASPCNSMMEHKASPCNSLRCRDSQCYTGRLCYLDEFQPVTAYTLHQCYSVAA